MNLIKFFDKIFNQILSDFLQIERTILKIKLVIFNKKLFFILHCLFHKICAMGFRQIFFDHFVALCILFALDILNNLITIYKVSLSPF
jgi:hypothetical protein